MPVRYAARPTRSDDASGRTKAATIATWSTSLSAIFRTDPEVIASVLPPPLAPPAEPVVKVGISRVDLGHGLPPFGAGTFAVAARHDGQDGYYPLLMPMSTEHAVIGGREIFGEPKKLADIALEVDGDSVVATVARNGVTIIEIRGTLGAELDPPTATEALDFYFKFLRSPEGAGFDDDPWLVHCTRKGETRAHRAVDGTLELRESRFDPIADIPVLTEPEITLSERRSQQRGRLVQRVPAAQVLPYMHQRYDDLIVAVPEDR